MRKQQVGVVCFLSLLASLPLSAQFRKLQAGSTFPENAQPGGTYTVTLGDASLGGGGTLYLPDNFTLKVASDVVQINWLFDKIVVGKNATFDLSRSVPLSKPSKAPNGSSTLSCFDIPERCDHKVQDISDGGNGGNGAAGVNGLNGANLVLRVHSLPSSGGLWIRTDGGLGGPGGDGGDGGRGDWGNCNGVHFHRGGNGGNGGAGGVGGRGGNVAVVRLEIFDPQSGQVQNEVIGSCANGSWPASRPPASSGDSGTIAIYGAPGIQGFSGKPGVGAERGHGINCGKWRTDAHDGANGTVGHSAPPSQDGLCYVGVRSRSK